MKLALGCLFWLVFLGLAYVFEQHWLQSLALPAGPGWLRPALAGALAFGLTMSAGGLHGVWVALCRREQAALPDFDEHRREGEIVRLGGVLEIDEEPIVAPFSGRAAAMLSYKAYPFVVDKERERERRAVDWAPRIYGRMQRRCWLRTRTQRIALQGFPCPDPMPNWRRNGDEAEAACAHHLANTRFEIVPDFGEHGVGAVVGQLRQLPARLAQLDEPGDHHQCNEAAAAMLGLTADGRDETTLRARLRALDPRWLFDEHAWMPGQEVTAVGTWQASPPTLDIGCSVRHPERGLLLGLPVARARHDLKGAIVFTLVMAALTALGHFALHHDDAAWLRMAVEALG